MLKTRVRVFPLALLAFLLLTGSDCGGGGFPEIVLIVNGDVTPIVGGMIVEDVSTSEPPDHIARVIFEVRDAQNVPIDSVVLPPAQPLQPNRHTFRPLASGDYTVTQTVIAVDEDTTRSIDYQRTVP